ncbi:hypothetical protein BC829DRAFT_62313 [Chytridium lagenaria]|nr:hypothetical protein BC829DRAFT_62313 [Chytridium lagenaria]
MLENVVPPPFVKHRVGNWCEESVLKESQLREFLDKSSRGLLKIERATLRLDTATQQVPLSSKLEYNANIMIKNISTKGFLSVDVPDNYPESIFETDVFSLTTSSETKTSTARTCFRLEPVDEYRIPGDTTIRYAQKFYIIASSALVDKPMYLCSEAKSFVSFAKKSKNQQAFLSFKKDNRSVWQIIYEEPKLRLESEGTPIELNTPVVIQHCLTGSCLGSTQTDKTLIRNNFGVEWEVDCHSHRDFGTRKEQSPNHWVLCISSLKKTDSSTHTHIP